MNNLTRDKVKECLSGFFNGKIYPILVCLAAFFSSILSIEIFVWPIAAIAFFFAAALSGSARPLIITFISFCFFISPTHSPSHTVSAIYGDGDTDYYFTEWRLPLSVLTVLLIVGGAVFFFIKNKCYKRISPKKDVFFVATLLFSLALLLGGAFSESYFDGLLLSLGQICVFSLFYFLFAYGLVGDSADGLMEYFSYISSLVAGVLILQLSHLYLTSDIIFVDGGINKEGVILGFGVWTLVGISLAMLIPAIFWGAMRGGVRGFVYLSIATLTLIFAILSMSRAAQLLSIAAYVACVATAAFKAKNKLFYRIMLGVILVSALALALIFSSKLSSMLVSFFDDNGRAEHAKIAIANFLAFPIFGVGFGGFESIKSLPDSLSPMGPLPAMAHSTPLQLLSATGIFGLLSYIFYRAAGIVPVLKKRTLSGVFALMSASVVLLGGLIDNFTFDIYPMFYSLVALAVAHRASE